MPTKYIEFSITPKDVEVAYAALVDQHIVDPVIQEGARHITARLKKRLDMPQWMGSVGGVMELTEANTRIFVDLLRKEGGAPAELAARIDPPRNEKQLTDLVKPLVWRETKGGDLTSTTEFGSYHIYRKVGSPFLMAPCMGLRRTDAPATWHSTEAAALAAAQTDFATRAISNFDQDKLLALIEVERPSEQTRETDAPGFDM